MTVVRSVNSQPYCVYAHFVNGECIYIGLGSIARAFGLRGRPASWYDVVRDAELNVVILEQFASRSDAAARERIMLSVFKPVCNTHGTGRTRHLRPILHVETGVKYTSVRHVCDEFGFDEDVVRAVLRGESPRIHGCTFRDLAAM